jgi:uncharacterized protein involved in exopolysaccharide biosynthesis
MNDQKYPVYDYFKFIWDKKLLLILATILFMIAAAAFSFTRTESYTSKALVFTGNGENERLSKPALIISEYKDELPENLSSSLDAKIVEPFQIQLTLSGADKNTVESELNKTANNYVADLTERFSQQYGVLENYVKAMEAKVKNTQKSIDLYTELVYKEGNEENLNRYIEILIKKEEAQVRYEEDLVEAQDELVLAEPPRFEGMTTNASSNNLLRNVFLGAALGFQLMLVILVFWKYVLNARRSESQK